MWKATRTKHTLVSSSARSTYHTQGYHPLLYTKSGRFVQLPWVAARTSPLRSGPARDFSNVSRPEKDILKKHSASLNLKEIDPNAVFEDDESAKPKLKLPISQRLQGMASTLPARIMKELHHYWDGTKQLGKDIVNAARIRTQIALGKKITRRERRIMMRTQTDIKLLGPFLVIAVVPFLEFALPVLLKLFPNMLPSTFVDKVQKERNLMRSQKSRLQLAHLLQDAIYFHVFEKKKRTGVDFTLFMDKIRSGQPIANAEHLQFSQMFKDDFVLDNLSRAHLVAMCRYMEVPAYGTVTLMKMLLQSRFRVLKQDDQVIVEEGLDSLNLEELQAALRDRGMRAAIDSEPVLKRRLAEWLDLSLIHKLPISMLVLSRALTFTENEKFEQALQENLAYLPQNLIDEVINSNLDANVEYLNQRAIELREKKAKEDKEKEKAAEAAAKEATSSATSTTASTTPLGFMTPLNNAISEANRADVLGLDQFHLLDTHTDQVLSTAELNDLIHKLKQKLNDEDVLGVLSQLEGKMSTNDILRFAAEREALRSQGQSLPKDA